MIVTKFRNMVFEEFTLLFITMRYGLLRTANVAKINKIG